MPSTTSWRAEIDGKRFSGMNEIDGSFWAISLKARSASPGTGNHETQLMAHATRGCATQS